MGFRRHFDSAPRTSALPRSADIADPWKPGHRQRIISEKLLADLAEVWEASGKAVLEKLATDDPGKLAQIAYGCLATSSSALNTGRRGICRPRIGRRWWTWCS
jgi:hypothetical protein